MAKAILVSGEPTVANIITPFDCEPGDVVISELYPMVAVGGGLEGDLVAFAVCGGVYAIPNAEGYNPFLGQIIPWDNTFGANNAGPLFGYSLGFIGGQLRAVHLPNGSEF
jgi:hypothetical protein